MVIQAYCNRCKKKNNILNPEIKEVTSSRRGVMKFCVGNCEICNNRISVILPKEIITNGKRKELEEKIERGNRELLKEKAVERHNQEKVREKMEEEKIQKQKEIDEQKINEFLEKSKENPIIQRNKEIIEVVDKTEKKVVSKRYYNLIIIALLVLIGFVGIFGYGVYYSKFNPYYNSTCEVNVTTICGDNICSQPTYTCPSCPSCSNECNFPDEIDINIKNYTG